MTAIDHNRLRVMLTVDATIYQYDVTDELLAAFTKFLVPGVTTDDIARALVDHRQSSNTRFTPAVVNEWVRRARLDRHSRATYAPPESLDGDPAREIPWKRTYAHLVASGTSARDAYLAACHDHHCDPDDPFPDDSARLRTKAAVDQLAAQHAVEAR